MFHPLSKTIESVVPGHGGQCRQTWINSNEVCRRVDGGISGFFRLAKKVRWWPWPVKYGPEFHGLIRSDGRVHSSALS